MGNNTTIGTISTRILLLVCLGFLTTILIPQNVEATHFRSGTISWTPTENPGEVEFRMKTVWRGDYPLWPNTPVGDSVNEGFFTFGDGTSTQITHTIVNRNNSENWVEFEAVFRKTYNGNGPFLANFQICCRISNSGNANDTNTRMEVLVSPNSGNNSPVSNQFPLVNVTRGSASSFFISAADPDNDQIRFRLSTIQETNFGSQVPGLSIDTNTGQVLWNNIGLSDDKLWSIQVTIEDLDENGNVKSKIPVEFVMQIIEDQDNLPDPPICEISPEGPYNISVENPISFDITATTTDPSATVTLAGIGLPSGSSMSPTLPVVGTETINSQFNWIPSASQTGSFVLTFSATDQFGQQTQCGSTINVTANQPPIADAGEDQTVTCPACDVELDGSGSSDPDGDTLNYTWTGEFGTVTGVNPTIELSLGEHAITLTVDDGQGETNSDEVTITVADTTPPELVTASEPYILWPPNHKHHTFEILDFIESVTDECDDNVSSENVVITRVTSDEPEEQAGSNNGKGRKGGGGDGNTTDDIVIAEDGLSVDLRAERLGGGNGRVYTAYVGVIDGSGNTTESSFQVHVPKSPNKPATDDGMTNGYEVTGLTPQPPVPAPAVIASSTSNENGTESLQFSASEISNESQENLPDSFVLNQNYPNPFNPSTIISYQVPDDVHVSIQVFDITGRLVATLVNEVKGSGNHQITFNASNLKSGIYLYKLQAGSFVEMNKMSLIK